MLAANVTPHKPRISPRAKVPGIAETARRLNREIGHVFRVLVGERPSPHAEEYRRVHAEVLREANFQKPTNKKASSGSNR